MSYCTLAQAKTELNASNTVDDNKLRRNIETVSRRIDNLMGYPRRPYFAPYIEQRGYTISNDRVSTLAGTFWLRDPLLAFSAVLRQTTSVTSLVELYNSGNGVADSLRFTSSSYSWYPTDNDLVRKVFVTGTWGWHSDYANAWEAVDALAAGINASVTSITVADADGADLDGFTPRFSPGNLIQIGSEWMMVNAVDTATNILTVRRGVNGSTAASHLISAAVSTYHVDDRISRITARQAALLYARIGAFQVETLDGVGVVTYPQDLLAELRATLQDFAYV